MAAATSEMWLRLELLALESEFLKLPEESTFEPLHFGPTNEPIPAGSPFAAHVTYPLPCDHGTLAAQKHPAAIVPGLFDTVHCFTMRQHLATELNEALTEYALQRECLADVALFEWAAQKENAELRGQEWVDAWLKGGPDSYDVGVRKTNVGGYQSQGDLFDADGDDAEAVEKLWGCRQLHRVCSAAMHALGSDAYPHGEGAAPPRAGEPHDSYAWLNVNRAGRSDCRAKQRHVCPAAAPAPVPAACACTCSPRCLP